MLFDLLIESKAFRNEEDVEKKSVKELSELLYLMMLTLQLLSLTRYSLDANNYVNTTLSYPMFERIYLSTTDLANILSTLRNAREYLAQSPADIPILDVKRYFRSFRSGTMSASERRSFFYRLQSKLKISNSVLTGFRRDIVDSDNLIFAQKKEIGHRLYDFLRSKEYKVDILAILQKFMDDSRE